MRPTQENADLFQGFRHRPVARYEWQRCEDLQFYRWNPRGAKQGDVICCLVESKSRTYPSIDPQTLEEFMRVPANKDAIGDFVSRHGLLSHAEAAVRGKSADIMWLDDWRKTQADIRIAMHLLRYWKDFQKVERFVSFPGGRGFQYARKTGGKFVRFDIWIDQDGTLYNEDERFGDRLDYSRLHYMGAAGHIADLAQMTQEAATNWPLTAARATLAKLVSKGMADCVAPWIAPSSGNVFQQHISARNLAGHLWLQIYFAMTGESVLRACEKCGGIMDVLGEGGRANRRYHPRCYKAVEMQRYRLRQRAQKGRAPKHASASGRPLRRV